MSETALDRIASRKVHECATLANFEAAYLTFDRDEDGTIYVSSWWYGSPKIVATISSGEVTVSDDV